MGREIICLAVMFLGMVATASAATACSNINTFGNNCEYQCHCAGGLACGADGSCPGRCASGWEGEYCQRANAAAGKSSTQSSTNGSYSSSLALDGNTDQDFLSCSHTTNQDQPWWQVDLGKEYVLFTMKIWHSIEEDVRECKTTQKGREYRGTMNTTRKGFTCDHWLNPNPLFKHNHSPANSSNYCRNPDDGKEPWCYTTETEDKNRWDYCAVPWCKEEEVRECKTTQRGAEYGGTLSTTRKGFKCDEWLNPKPRFKHNYSPAKSSNYCRNPENHETEPWCYTTERERKNRWDYCDVPWCKEDDVRECKTTLRGTAYGGTLSTTRKGFKCDEWLNPNPRFTHNYWPAKSSNYCRNPDNHETEPWCYTTETERKNRWDYCDVPWCKAKLNNFKIWMNRTLCHHYMYNGTVGLGQTVDIRCDTPVVGRDLKIQLLDSSTVLTLCEVTIQAFQYKACSNKYYGPNCNNRCQCANDVTCDNKTGLCPNGTCNDRFTGPYCNIGIPSVSKNGASTPTAICVKWQYIIHDSAYDAGKVTGIDLKYQEYMSPSLLSRLNVSDPSPGMMSANVTKLKPSTRYSFHIRLKYESLKTGSVPPVQGPTATFQTKSCEGYMVIPVIRVINTIPTSSTWPDRVALEIKAEVPGMIAGCKKELDVYVKKTNETNYVNITKADQTYTIRGLTAFTEYDINATVRSPDGCEKDNIQTIRTAEDVPSAPTIAKAGVSPTSVSIRITPPDPPYGIITKYDLEMWEAGSSGRMYSYGPANLTHTFDELKLNTTYKFKIKAFTSAGGGVWSKEISIITDENIQRSKLEGSVVGLAVGLTIGILIILAAIIIPAVVVIRRRRAALWTTYERPMPMYDAPSSKDANVYDDLYARRPTDRATYYTLTPVNETPLYEDIAIGGRGGPHGRVAVIHDQDYANA